MVYERSLIASKPEDEQVKVLTTVTDGDITPDVILKSSYVVDFLGLKRGFSEEELEDAVVEQLENFIMELGKDFAFLERQKKIPVDSIDYKLDLLFYHRHCQGTAGQKGNRITKPLTWVVCFSSPARPGISYFRADVGIAFPAYPQRILIHRVWWSNSDVLSIAIFDDRVEFANPGAFPPGTSPETFYKRPQSKPINKLISEVFFKSGLMEAWGRGIPDIFDLCKENGLPKPEFELAYGYVYLTIRFAKPLTPPAAKPSSTTVSMSSKAAKSSPFRMPTPTTPGSKKSPSAPGSPSKYPTTSFAKPRPIRKPLVPMSPTSSSPGS